MVTDKASRYTQAEVEALFNRRWEMVRTGIKTTVGAYDLPEEKWVVRLDNHILILHPYARRWLYYNRTHDTWDETGLAPGEALFFTVGNSLCAKKIPGESQVQGQAPQESPEPAHWFIYIHKGQLSGPELKASLKRKLSSGDLPAGVLVFNAAMTVWQSAERVGLNKPAFPETTARGNQPVPAAKAAGQCPGCKTRCQAGDLFCSNCGLNLAEALNLCHVCGNSLNTSDLFCDACGAALRNKNE